MDVKLTRITASEYDKLPLSILFDDKEFDHVFAILSSDKNDYKLGWQSNLIEPVIVAISASLCLVGVDLVFVIFDKEEGKIRFKLSLDCYFYDAILHEEHVLIITQLEIIKLHISSLTISERYALPNIFEDIEFKENRILVKCVDNEQITI